MTVQVDRDARRTLRRTSIASFLHG
jgi:hypothetical protein